MLERLLYRFQLLVFLLKRIMCDRYEYIDYFIIDFCKAYPDLSIQLFHSGGIFHDRYIILDYGTDDEKVFLCGASSKDAGGRITSILEDPDRMKYDLMIKDLLKNNQLVLK